MKRFLLSLALLLNCPIALADSGPLGFGTSEFSQEMETDRPDFTEGAQTVQAGHLQIESGYTFVYDDEDGVEVDDHTLPELLFRAGISDNLELRLAWEGWSSTKVKADGFSERSEGLTDTSIGFKHSLIEQNESLPALSYILELGLPTGAERKTADEVEPALVIIWAKDLNDSYSLGGNINFAWPIDSEDDRYFEAASSLALGMDLGNSFGTYLEYFGFYPNDSADEESTHYASSGITYSCSKNSQLDFRVGVGINDDAADFFTGVGYSIRI